MFAFMGLFPACFIGTHEQTNCVQIESDCIPLCKPLQVTTLVRQAANFKAAAVGSHEWVAASDAAGER